MNKNFITLEGSSPNELKDILKRLSGKKKLSRAYCALAIGDPEFILYPFSFKDTSLSDAKEQVCEEIRKIFDMPLSNIEYDFQIFERDEDFFYGVCAAIPKKRLHQYLRVLDQNILTPLRIIPYTSAIIDYYFYKHKAPEVSFAVVDFSRKHLIGIAVFKEERCQLLRQIPYDRLHDVVSEIINSLKNACMSSGIAHLDRIHFAGTLEDKMEIVEDIEASFQAKIECDHSIDIVTALSIENQYFDINFARRYTLTESERVHTMRAAKLLLALYCLFVILLGSQIFFRFQKLKNLDSSYTITDYNYAQNLKKELDSF